MRPYVGRMSTITDTERRVEALLRDRAAYHQDMADRYRRLAGLLFPEPAKSRRTCRGDDSRLGPGSGGASEPLR